MITGVSMQSFPRHIHRVFKPSHLDMAPFATKCIVEGDEYYVQISRNENDPDWHSVSCEEKADELIQELLRKS